MPPCTTKRKTTTNLKTKHIQNCQEIELYGSPTTKELKEKYSSIPVGGVEMGSQGGKDSQQRTQSRRSHIWVQIIQEELLGIKTVPPRDLVQGNKASQPLTEKTLSLIHI